MTAAYGPMQPGDTSSTFNVISFIIQRALERVRTITLAQVQAVYGGSINGPPTVDALPLVNMLDGNGNATQHVTVFGCPVWRMQAGSSGVIADPIVGDVGILLICDRDISSVKMTAAQANPGTFRKFDFADGIYLGGMLGPALTQYIQFLTTGINLLDVNGNKIQTSSSGIVLTDLNGNKIQTSPTGMVLTTAAGGVVNIIATALQVNGVPVTVP